MKVYVVYKHKTEDYHGTYTEVINIYDNENTARNRVEKLERENTEGSDIYYSWEEFPVLRG